MFKIRTGQVAKTILKLYQTVDESEDTYSYWLKKVATDRNISTIAIRLNVNYFLAKGNPIVTDRHGDPKVFVLPKELRTEPVSYYPGTKLGNTVLTCIKQFSFRLG